MMRGPVPVGVFVTCARRCRGNARQDSHRSSWGRLPSTANRPADDMLHTNVSDEGVHLNAALYARNLSERWQRVALTS